MDTSDPNESGSNPNGGDTVILTIPKFTSKPKNDLVNEGGTIRLPCMVDRLGKMAIN